MVRTSRRHPPLTEEFRSDHHAKKQPEGVTGAVELDDRHCWDDVVGPRELLFTETFRGPREFGRSPALVLIDVYNKAFGDRPEPIEESVRRFPASCGMAAWDALEPTGELLALARRTGIPVVYSRGEARTEARLGGATRRAQPDDEDDQWGYAIVDKVAPQADDLVIYKARASAFFGTPLEAYLRLLGVDTLVIAGETTSGCVRATVIDAYSHGFNIVLAEEAIFDRSPLSHKVNLFDMHHKYGTVLHLKEALTYLADPQSIG
ncbi:MAG: isochorismatase family protein [Streptosporangiales bacterium]|nr:isochorismatase family protein [Streptosporangiales bacterium]